MNLDADLAASRTPSEARAVQDNHDSLLASYMEALRTAFECSSADWEQLLGDAQDAQNAVDDARHNAGTLAERLGAMTSLTTAVSNLIEAAK